VRVEVEQSIAIQNPLRDSNGRGGGGEAIERDVAMEGLDLLHGFEISGLRRNLGVVSRGRGRERRGGGQSGVEEVIS
jgi:hypothetical protein